jgi:hypothetical protein
MSSYPKPVPHVPIQISEQSSLDADIRDLANPQEGLLAQDGRVNPGRLFDYFNELTGRGNFAVDITPLARKDEPNFGSKIHISNVAESLFMGLSVNKNFQNGHHTYYTFRIMPGKLACTATVFREPRSNNPHGVLYSNVPETGSKELGMLYPSRVLNLGVRALRWRDLTRTTSKTPV